jgi:hypothetical protein
MHERMCVCMHLCVYVCVYACVPVCMCACVLNQLMAPHTWGGGASVGAFVASGPLMWVHACVCLCVCACVRVTQRMAPHTCHSCVALRRPAALRTPPALPCYLHQGPARLSAPVSVCVCVCFVRTRVYVLGIRQLHQGPARPSALVRACV